MAHSMIERVAMTRALSLALHGPRGINPQVGAVILSADGEVLAEGWHRGAGTAHAEVDALSHLAPGAAAGATAVVTLEPCRHTGRTGPCAQALIDAGIERVVYAVDDPNADSGGGAQVLRAAGVDVEPGVLGDEGRMLLGSWLDVQHRGRPRVTVKWAQSLDGRAAAADGSSQWITGPAARHDVHRRRAAHDAILVGTGTVHADDPALTAREPDGSLRAAQPVPVVVGDRPIPEGAAVHRHPHRPILLRRADPADALTELADRGIHTVFVEGGPTVAAAFLRAGVVDDVLAYVAPLLLGGARVALDDLGVAGIADGIRLHTSAIERLGDDLLVIAHPQAPGPEGDA